MTVSVSDTDSDTLFLPLLKFCAGQRFIDCIIIIHTVTVGVTVTVTDSDVTESETDCHSVSDRHRCQ